MKKCRKSAIILIAIMTVSAIVSFILLPKEIAVQRNINGIYSTAFPMDSVFISCRRCAD